MNNENQFKLLFLDTETTGREEKDRIFQVAYDYKDVEYSELFTPPLPICIEAMEATGYTNKDVAGKEKFAESKMYTELRGIMQNAQTVFIAHNAAFDIEMLRRDGIETGAFIDTLKIARHLDPEAKLGAYRLQYLRYALELEVGDAQAHDALGDVRVLKALYNRLSKKLSVGEMIEISSKPVYIARITFGKHAGKLLADIAKEDRGYLEWLLRQKEEDAEDSHDQNEDWIYSLKKVLGIMI